MPESMYQRALIIVLQRAGLEVESEVPVRVYFRGQPIGDYRLDLIVEGVVIVECKVAGRIHSEHTRQLLRYLRITRMEVGLVLNFGPTAQCKRVAHTPREDDGAGDVEFRRRDR